MRRAYDLAQGDLGGARKAFERSLALTVKVHGTEEHPDVAVSVHVLGVVLYDQSDLAGARAAFERSIAINTRVLGTREHPDIDATRRALGHVLEAQGNTADAQPTPAAHPCPCGSGNVFPTCHGLPDDPQSD